MAGNRAAAVKQLLEDIALLDNSGNRENLVYYTELIKRMSNEAFEAWVNRIASGEEYIQMKVPNFQGKLHTFERLKEIAKIMGCPLFERVWVTDRATGVRMLTPHEYPIIFQPVRAQSQSLMSKISVAPNNNVIDNLTGQPTGDSKTSTVSSVEQQVLTTHGADRAVEELIRPRGGNLEAMAVFEKQFLEQGHASLDAPGMEVGVVRALETSGAYLFAMGIDHNLTKSGPV